MDKNIEKENIKNNSTEEIDRDINDNEIEALANRIRKEDENIDIEEEIDQLTINTDIDEHVVEIFSLIKGNDEKTKELAVLMLGKSKEISTVSSLIDCLGEESLDLSKITEAVREIIENIQIEKTTRSYKEDFNLDEYLSEENSEFKLEDYLKKGSGGDLILPKLREIKDGESQEAKAEAIKMLGIFNDWESFDDIKESLNSEDDNIVKAAIEALHEMGEASIEKFIEIFEKTNDKSLKELIFRTLSEIVENNEDVLRFFVKNIKDESFSYVSYEVLSDLDPEKIDNFLDEEAREIIDKYKS